jgi:gamma-glutamyl hydrolase
LYDFYRLLLPGGAAEFNATDGYATAGWELYKLAKLKNDAGIYFPVWGTCLGFELLAFLSPNKTETRSACSVERIAISLKMKPGKATRIQ